MSETLPFEGWRIERLNHHVGGAFSFLDAAEHGQLSRQLLAHKPSLLRLRENIKTAEDAVDDGFVIGLSEQERPVWLESKKLAFSMAGSSERVAKNLGITQEVFDKTLGELRERRKPLLEALAANRKAFFGEYLLAQKELCRANPSYRTQLLSMLDDKLIADNNKWSWFIEDVKYVRDLESAAYAHSASPSELINALENDLSGNHGLRQVVGQAHLIAEIDGVPISQAIEGRMQKLGLSSNQIAIYKEAAEAFENGTHRAYLDGLTDQFYQGKTVEEISRRHAEIRREIREANPEYFGGAETKGASHEPNGRGSQNAAGLGEDAQNTAKLAEKEESWLSRVGKSITEKPGRAAAIAAGAAVVIGGGAWALGEMNKKTESETKPKQL